MHSNHATRAFFKSGTGVVLAVYDARKGQVGCSCLFLQQHMRHSAAVLWHLCAASWQREVPAAP